MSPVPPLLPAEPSRPFVGAIVAREFESAVRRLNTFVVSKTLRKKKLHASESAMSGNFGAHGAGRGRNVNAVGRPGVQEASAPQNKAPIVVDREKARKRL
jgi:hypothetical protein